jgi:dimethylaniline monooxygenase (N-oxide forming)
MSPRTERIAIIGAGVAGLSTARQLIAEGFDCTLFERNSELGGVWSDGYLNFGVQVQRELYEFPDWPLPEDTPNFTPGPIIQEYLQAYADHFEISPRIRFDTRVSHLAETGSPEVGWTVSTETSNGTNEEIFDRVVICIGLYSNRPNIPEFPGREEFEGEVIHNSRLKSAEQLKDRCVAVVGFGKSASDAALEAASAASEAHIVFREPHWPIPRKLAGVLPFKWGLLNRLCSTLIPPYQEMTSVEKTVHNIGKPMAWFYWRIVETLFYFQCRIGSNFGTRVSLVPRLPVEIDAFGESTQVPRAEFFRLARSGDINLHRTVIDKYTPRGVQLANGEFLDVDLVIMATGWLTDFGFIDPDVWSRLGPGDDGFYLYRHIMNPNVPGLFFIGRASTISSITTYSLQARWLASVLTQQVQLPPVEAMRRNIEEMRDWKQSWMPFSSARSARLIAHTQHYHDELLKDLGTSPLRKTGFFAPLKELVFPYEPKDYASVVSRELDAP